MKPAFVLISSALPVLLGSATALQAQDVRYGLQVHGDIPSGDLRDAADNKAGFGGGAHMTIDLGDGHRLRPRLDYVTYPDPKTAVPLGYSPNSKSKVTDASLGLDYVYDFGGRDGGFYLTAGLALHRFKAEYNYAVQIGNITGSVTASSTSSKVGAAAGAGFNINPNFAIEARYVASKFEQGSADRTAGAVQLAALYRF